MIAIFLLAAALPAGTTTGPAVEDHRRTLVALDLAREPRHALEQTSASIRTDPDLARAEGLDYFRGHLLEELGRARDATEAFAQALTSSSPLAPWARLRLAEIQNALGHPEVAAGLVATLLAHKPPEVLSRRALRLFEHAILDGGDCRLLGGLPRDRFTGDERRIRDLLDLVCRSRQAGTPPSRDAVRSFLEGGTSDAPAWEAAGLLIGDAPTGDRRLDLLLAMTSYHHRDFDRARGLFAALAPLVPSSPLDRLTRDALYARARSAFWLGRYHEAGEQFRAIARDASDTSDASAADHQLGRSLELAGDLDGARDAFSRSYGEDPQGDWAGPSLLSLLRIDWLAGDEAGARGRLQTLAGGSRFAALTCRGALFIAVSQLVRGRTAGVEPLLALAQRTGEAADEEVEYWRGRLAELDGDASRAVELYLEATQQRPFHPFARAALDRLRRPDLADAVREQLARSRASRRPDELRRAAWLADGDLQRQLSGAGRRALERNPSAAAWLEGGFLEVADWPIWRTGPGERPTDLLGALGLLAEIDTATRQFPPSNPKTGLTGSLLLARNGAFRRSIELAEMVFERRPDAVPLEWVAPEWTRLLYPMPWRQAIEGQAAAQGLDPALIAAVLREESRFDPQATSAAGARGLSQLVLPTAARLAQIDGLASLRPRDLDDPLLAILLGTAYLRELSDRFQGDLVAVAAAYNAGEDQTSLWQRSCYTTEDMELLSKIGFGETRAYVSRVLQGLAVYHYLASLPPS